MLNFGFGVVDSFDEYELLALSFDETMPMFSKTITQNHTVSQDLTIYYSPQCPYILNSTKQIENFCNLNKIPLNLIAVDTLEKSKNLPCVFNNWGVFYKGKFQTLQISNEGSLKKLLGL